ncbi:hypothetical protein ACWKW1_26475, partial [Brevibacillus parabrevis]
MEYFNIYVDLKMKLQKHESVKHSRLGIGEKGGSIANAGNRWRHDLSRFASRLAVWADPAGQ